MLSNTIILTSGETGSSVLAGLLARAGYWLGDETAEVAYKTFENQTLIDLNMNVLGATDYGWHDSINYPAPGVQQVEDATHGLDCSSHQAFIDKCLKNSPFLWKDPRLSYTIYFWDKMMDLGSARFIVMTRDLKQTWTGTVLRGKFPIALDDMKTVHNNCNEYALNYLNNKGFDFIHVTFEELIVEPEQTIERLNCFLSTELTTEDLGAVYRGQLGSTRWSNMDFLKANLKFLYYKFVSRDVIRFPRVKSS